MAFASTTVTFAAPSSFFRSHLRSCLPPPPSSLSSLPSLPASSLTQSHHLPPLVLPLSAMGAWIHSPPPSALSPPSASPSSSSSSPSSTTRHHSPSASVADHPASATVPSPALLLPFLSLLIVGPVPSLLANEHADASPHLFYPLLQPRRLSSSSLSWSSMAICRPSAMAFVTEHHRPLLPLHLTAAAHFPLPPPVAENYRPDTALPLLCSFPLLSPRPLQLRLCRSFSTMASPPPLMTTPSRATTAFFLHSHDKLSLVL